jgi:hypothetical protein
MRRAVILRANDNTAEDRTHDPGRAEKARER